MPETGKISKAQVKHLDLVFLHELHDVFGSAHKNFSPLPAARLVLTELDIRNLEAGTLQSISGEPRRWEIECFYGGDNGDLLFTKRCDSSDLDGAKMAEAFPLCWKLILLRSKYAPAYILHTMKSTAQLQRPGAPSAELRKQGQKALDWIAD